MVAQFNIFKPPDLIQFQVAADIWDYLLERAEPVKEYTHNIPSGHAPI
jgi:hypothetical protein